jgi:hypothetical protein
MENFGKSLKNTMKNEFSKTGQSGIDFTSASNTYVSNIEEKEDSSIIKKTYKKSEIGNILSKNKPKMNLPIGKLFSLGKSETKESTGSGSAGSYFQPLFVKTKQQIKEEVLKGGLADNMSLEDICKRHKKKHPNLTLDELKKQLKKGIKTELEHTENKNKAKEIAMDHLFEDPKYYDKIQKIETKEATGASSSGSYETPAAWAKSMSKKDWRGKSKTQIPGGKFVQVKEKCKKFPYCNQGDINALKLTDK